MLVMAVAMSAGLIAAVACAMASLNLAVGQRIKATVGASDLRLRHVGNGTFDSAILSSARTWDGVAIASGRLKDALALRLESGKEGDTNAIACWGVDPQVEGKIRPYTLFKGRYLAGKGELVLDRAAARTLKAEVGMKLVVERFGPPVMLTVVGIVEPPPLGAIVERDECFVTLETLGEISAEAGRLSEVDIILSPGVNAEQAAKDLRATANLPPAILLQLTEKITSGLEKNLESNQIGFYLASVLAFMAASFIIATGLTTGVTERTRELAVLRSIGAQRRQLAAAQLLVGTLTGAMGAVLGVPLGVLSAWLLVKGFAEQLPGGFGFSLLGVVMAFVGSILAGLIGAAWPAVAAARVSPLEGLALRSKSPALRWVWVCLFAGLACIAVQVTLMEVPTDGNTIFWSYVTCGLPVMMLGYFLLGVPVTWVVAKAIAMPVSKVLRLPGRMLERATAATPFRHGFTAACMMLGLALMVAIWTNGRAIMRDWLDSLALPDAFIYGTNLRPDSVDRVRAEVPEIVTTCAITVQNVDTNFRGGSNEKPQEVDPNANPQSKGVRGLGKYSTSFVGFEPDTFFSMTKLSWEQGDEKTATAKLMAGGAVIISREFGVTRGAKLGDALQVKFNDRVHSFEVVGVVSSPGLDIVSKFLEVGEQYMDQSINAICGSRQDLKEKFGNDSISFIQMQFKPGLTGDEGKAILSKARKAVGPGVLVSVTAVEMKGRIREFIGGGLLVMSIVSIGAMLVACLSVANLIVAAIHARQFEFGVLRAVGADRSLLTRIILGEAILIGVSACVLGTALGLHGAWAGRIIHKVTIGLLLNTSVPWLELALGWAAVVTITVGAAVPAVIRLARKHPRELLAAVRG